MSVCGCQNVLDNRKYNQSAIKMTFNMRHASPARLVASRFVSSRLLLLLHHLHSFLGLSSGLSALPPSLSLSLSLSLYMRFLFHFTSFEGWNSIYLKTHQTANFMNLQRFGFCPSNPPCPPAPSLPSAALRHFFCTPPLGVTAGRQLSGCVRVCHV